VSAAAERDLVVFEDVSKFYGEVLGVDRVTLSIPPGITGLVGPNGSGKTTLMNLATGLIRPTRGRIRILGVPPDDPERLFVLCGYCTGFEAFPPGVTGRSFLEGILSLRGGGREAARDLAARALERVGLVDAADRKAAGYSKGMKQRLRLAAAIAPDPQVLLLDEPLNGLDPMARAEALELFRALAAEGKHVVVSSHILHEVDLLADRVVLVKSGYVVAEGESHGLREEVVERPMQVLVRCDRPSALAARLFADGLVTEVELHDDGGGLLARTRTPDRFFLALNVAVLSDGLEVETVTPADDDVKAVYRYLIEGGEGS
jgi:ABC-2 type transport system ATP-binding protein